MKDAVAANHSTKFRPTADRQSLNRFIGLTLLWPRGTYAITFAL